MLRCAWMAAALGVALAVACGGASDEDGLFGGGGDAGTGGQAGSSLGGASGGGGESGSGSDPDASAGVGGGAGESGSAGASGEDAGPDYTLENVCEKLPAKTCALRQSCCGQSGIGFDQAQCEAKESEICVELVKQVNAGQRSFDPSLIDPCFDALTPLMAACKFTGDQYVSFLKATNTCNAVFASKNGPGTPCGQASDCAPSTNPNGYSGCSDNGQCYQATFAQQGDACNQSICDDGLGCVYPPLGPTPQCEPKTPLNGPCTSSAQCGYGFYCPFQVGGSVCKAAQPGGSGCASALHCLSLECNIGQCAEQPLYVSADNCGK